MLTGKKDTRCHPIECGEYEVFSPFALSTLRRYNPARDHDRKDRICIIAVGQLDGDATFVARFTDLQQLTIFDVKWWNLIFNNSNLISVNEPLLHKSYRGCGRDMHGAFLKVYKRESKIVLVESNVRQALW